MYNANEQDEWARKSVTPLIEIAVEGRAMPFTPGYLMSVFKVNDEGTLVLAWDNMFITDHRSLPICLGRF